MENQKINYVTASLGAGFLVWLSATILFRVAGHYFFLTENLSVMIAMYLLLIPVLGLISTLLFKRFNLNTFESIKSATLMVLPGMFLDTLCIQFFGQIFPNMRERDVGSFSSWLMFAYSVVLIFGLLRKTKK
jgi:hypothetical protein